MVERWLQQLEQQMMISLRDVAAEAITAYTLTKREEWVLNWPGQIVQAGSCVQYTSEAIEAIETNTLPDLINRSTEQINGLVYVVQGDLEPGHRITVEALIVIDVHGKLNILNSCVKKYKLISNILLILRSFNPRGNGAKKSPGYNGL